MPTRYLLVSFLAQKFGGGGGPGGSGSRQTAGGPALLRLGFVIADVLDRGERLDDDEGRAWATVLAGHLARHYAAPNAGPERSVAPLDERVGAAVEFIDTHLQQHLTVDRLAEIAGLSRMRFVELFKAGLGLAPHQFVLEQRIARSRQLLASTELSLTEVAYAVGFSSQSHMTSAFRRSVGTTPGAYRAALYR